MERDMLVKKISGALMQNDIVREKDKYYIVKNGKKELVEKEDLLRTYDVMVKYLSIESETLEKKDKYNTEEELEEALIGYFAIISTLVRNVLNKNYDKVIDENLKRLPEIMNKRGAQIVLEKVLDKKYYYPKVMLKMYQNGLVSKLDCYMKTQIMYDKKWISDTEVLDLLDEEELPKTIVYEILGEDKILELYKKNKSSKYIETIPVSKIIDLYEKEKLSKQDLEKSHLGKKTIIEKLEEKVYVEQIYEFLQKDIPEKLVPNSQEFISLLRGRKISNDECIQFIMLDKVKKVNGLNEELIKCYQDGFFNNREMFSFIKNGMVEDELLFEMHEKQQMVKSAVLFPDIFKDAFITDEELREYFTVDKLLERTKSKKLSCESLEEYFDFYREILPKDEEELVQFEEQIVERLRGKEDPLDNMLLLWKKGILNIDRIRNDINEDEVIEKQEEIGARDLCNLYNYGILSIEALSIIFEDRTDEIALACNKNRLDESALELMSQEEIYQYYMEKQLTNKNMLKVYQYGILSVEDLKKLGIKINNENIIDETFSVEQIRELFLSRILNYDKLLQLQQREIITQEEFIQINKEFNFDAAIAELESHGDIENEALPQGNRGGRGKYSRLNFDEETQRKLPNISAQSRLEYFKLLKAKEPKPIYASSKLSKKAALEGYDYIVAKELGVVILEKFYEDNTDERMISAVENATYILPPVKLIEYLEKSNKQDLREDKNVRYVYHTSNWGMNLLKACAEVNPELDKKELRKQYKDFNELLKQEYEENVRG